MLISRKGSPWGAHNSRNSSRNCLTKAQKPDPCVLSKFDFRATVFPLRLQVRQTLSKIYVFTSISNIIFSLCLSFSLKPLAHIIALKEFCFCFSFMFFFFEVCLHFYLDHFKVFRATK